MACQFCEKTRALSKDENGNSMVLYCRPCFKRRQKRQKAKKKA